MGEVVGNTSLMSFSKVPCTPITGVHVNFYDVFGDVERIGTGSSWRSSTGSIYSSTGMDDQLQLEGEEEVKAERVRSHYCRKCRIDIFGPAHLDPHVLFLQQKEEELLRELHEEIRLLKQENSDLKFQVHVILCQRQEARSRNASARNKGKSSVSLASENETSLKPALEAATKMIEEFKWIQQHYEKKISMQERMIEDLLRQQRKPAKLKESINDFPVQTATSTLHQLFNLGNFNNSRFAKSGHQRVHNPTTPNQDGEPSRRNSTQSLLPENYKERVATLPPIMNCDPLNTNSVRNPVMSDFKLKNKYGQNTGKSKRSSLGNLQNIPGLSPNISPATNPLSEDSDRSNCESHFYMSK